LKLRASIGKNANQGISYSQGVMYTGKYNISIPGLVLAAISNKNAKWETVTKSNAGFDAVLFNYKLKLSLDAFQDKVSDMLVPVAVQGTEGFASYWSNGGAMEMKGLELGIGSQGKLNKIGWDVMFNITKDKNKITSLPQNKPIISDYYGYQSIAQVGSPAGLFYGYKVLGVFATTEEANSAKLMGNKGMYFTAGEFHYDDLNKDGRIDEYDRQVIGDPNPDFYGDLSARISYGNFELNLLFNFCYGNDVMNVLRSRIEVPVAYENLSRAAVNRWRTEGDIANIPFTRFGDLQDLSRPSSQWVEDGSFIKLRSLGLSYDFNKQFAFVRYVRFFANAYNLLTFTKYLGFDPEFRTGTSPFTMGYDFGNIPVSRSVVLGVKFGF